MYTRHNEVPAYEYRDVMIDAVYYNIVQTAFKRLDKEIRLVLPKLKTLDLIIQLDAWIVVDRAFNDIPVVAWANFQAGNRDALHTPVNCQLRLFHANGNMIINQVLKDMVLLLEERLNENDSFHKVIDFPVSK